MKLYGRYWYAHDYPPTEFGNSGEVDDCILEEDKLSLDYTDAGELYHFDAQGSNDIFIGDYFGKTSREKGKLTLRHYTSGTKHLFYGTWRSEDLSQEGTYLFDLDEED